MDNGTIDFYRNGKHLGRAFKDIGMGYGFAYFPTVSLAVTENLTANFGSTPMHYPIEGYEPLQAAPQKEITQATFLFEWFLQIIKLIDTKKNEDEQNTSCDGNMSIQAFLMCLSSLILKHMGSIFTYDTIHHRIYLYSIRGTTYRIENRFSERIYTVDCTFFYVINLFRFIMDLSRGARN